MYGGELRSTRLARGLSTQALAERAGLSIAAIQYLEAHGDLPQRSPAQRVREALGLPPPTDHDAIPEPAPEAPDDVAIEALIADTATGCHEEHLADALRWTLPRVIAAIRALDQRLARTGQVLIRDARDGYTLGARHSVVDDDARRSVRERQLADLDPLTALILRDILEGATKKRRWTNFTTPDEQQAIRHLLAAELIEDNMATLGPTRRALAAFGLMGSVDGFWQYQRIALEYGI